MNNETVLTASVGRWRAWLAVIALGISTFTIVTSELAPVGMLGMLANGLHQTESAAGLVVTAYGWVGALAALCSAWLPAGIPRKGMLVGLMLTMAVSSLLAAHAGSMSAFVSARMAGAIAHGAFWAMIGSVAGQLVPKEQLGRATSIIFGGVSAASVLGVPLVSALAGSQGWREAFTTITLLSLLAAVVLAGTLPALSAPAGHTPQLGRGLRSHPQMPILYVATAVIISAHFAAFTYIQPMLTGLQDIPYSGISALLLVSGLAGLVGNVIAGKLIDRHLKRLITLSLFISAVALAVLGLKGLAPLPVAVITVLLGLWGAAIAVIFVGLQTWVLRNAGDAAQSASALYVAIFNAAIGFGALIGGRLLAIAGIQGMVLVSAALLLAGGLLIVRLTKP